MICNKRKFMYIRVAKTGTTSIQRALFPMNIYGPWKVYDDRVNTKIPGWDKEHKKDPNHYPMKKLKKIYGIKKWNEYFKFAFVRNPWDRCVSAWKYNISKSYTEDMPLFDFLRQLNHRDINSKYLHQYKYTSGCDYIGRFENIQQDFDIICDKLNIPHRELPHDNSTKHKHYTEYYDDETIRYVENRFKKDIDIFNYKFGI